MLSVEGMGPSTLRTAWLVTIVGALALAAPPATRAGEAQAALQLRLRVVSRISVAARVSAGAPEVIATVSRPATHAPRVALAPAAATPPGAGEARVAVATVFADGDPGEVRFLAAAP